MSRPIGIAKTGGRKAGTPNKKTHVIRGLMDDLQFDPFAKLVELLPDLKPHIQAQICLKLMDYKYSKRKAVEDFYEVDNQSELREESLGFLKF